MLSECVLCTSEPLLPQSPDHRCVATLWMPPAGMSSGSWGTGGRRSWAGLWCGTAEDDCWFHCGSRHLSRPPRCRHRLELEPYTDPSFTSARTTQHCNKHTDTSRGPERTTGRRGDHGARGGHGDERGPRGREGATGTRADHGDERDHREERGHGDERGPWGREGATGTRADHGDKRGPQEREGTKGTRGDHGEERGPRGGEGPTGPTGTHTQGEERGPRE